MKYCTHCGTELTGNTKFCTSCGTKTEMSNGKIEKPLMYKGESKSLKDKAMDFGKKSLQNDFGKQVQDGATNYVKSRLEESFSSNTLKENPTINNISETQTPENQTISKGKTINKWTWIYIIMNALLLILGSKSEEVVGVLIFSVIILAIVFFRRKKEKPYNWLVKIILVVQLIFLVALIAESIEYISFFTLVFMGLLLANLALLFKGNN
ncbi:MAG: zinc ribbon domain-containing protein [Lutibacter sp.]|nr:zinc ribbon domain-containing protein [Lutibacter sp.]